MAEDTSTYLIGSDVYTPGQVPPLPLSDDPAEVARLLELTRATIQNAPKETDGG
jgi:hypothetical protein